MVDHLAFLIMKRRIKSKIIMKSKIGIQPQNIEQTKMIANKAT